MLVYLWIAYDLDAIFYMYVILFYLWMICYCFEIICLSGMYPDYFDIPLCNNQICVITYYTPIWNVYVIWDNYCELSNFDIFPYCSTVILFVLFSFEKCLILLLYDYYKKFICVPAFSGRYLSHVLVQYEILQHSTHIFQKCNVILLSHVIFHFETYTSNISYMV